MFQLVSEINVWPFKLNSHICALDLLGFQGGVGYSKGFMKKVLLWSQLNVRKWWNVNFQKVTEYFSTEVTSAGSTEADEIESCEKSSAERYTVTLYNISQIW